MQRNSIEFRHVSKAFGACIANEDLSFAIPQGSIHALIGENGAGKSTAMKILYGMQSADSGEIFIDGQAVNFSTPLEAIAAGVGMVHQHFMLAGVHSVLDNILLGAEGSFLLAPIARGRAREKIKAILQKQKWNLNLDASIENLPVGLQQRVEIVKLLFRDSQILILDEPTAVLTPAETDELFANLRELKAQGKTIIIITHKLKEVMKIADGITVMRAGRVVAERQAANTGVAELAELMVGRKVNLARPSEAISQRGSAPILAAKSLLRGIDLDIYGGEIVGIAGVEGNGQKELIESLVFPGQHWNKDSSVRFLGEDTENLSTADLRQRGMGILAQDRLAESLAPNFPAWENFLLGQDWRKTFQKAGWLFRKKIQKQATQKLEDYSVRPANIHLAAGRFSGGNQQKMVVARELSQSPKFLLAAQPTRGVDVGAIEFIHAQLRQARAEGAAILLFSAELDEILALADRILVIFEEKIVAELLPQNADERTLGTFMGGGKL